MARRMTETTKWSDPWFNSLSNEMKLFWIYILDNCNHAGLWEPNWPLLNYHLKLKEKDIEFGLFNGRVEIFESGKWFIKKFVDFQYGCLKKENRVHNSVLMALSKEGASKPLASPLEGCKDKDKEKDKSLSLEDRGTGEGDVGKKFAPPTPIEVSNYAKSINFNLNGESFCSHYEAKGWMIGKSRMKNWKAAVKTWKIKSHEEAGYGDNGTKPLSHFERALKRIDG